MVQGVKPKKLLVSLSAPHESRLSVRLRMASNSATGREKREQQQGCGLHEQAITKGIKRLQEILPILILSGFSEMFCYS